MTALGALPDANGALAYGIGNGGHVVGTSMFNQGSGAPFVWTAATGMVAIDLPAGTTMGSARDVNDQGWVVGTAAGSFATPYLWIDGTSYTLQSLLADADGWDLSMNSSSSAMAIANNGSIVGTALHNGQTHAYMMVLVSSVPEPGSWALMAGGLALCGVVVRRRREAQAA